jgi:dihydrofolate synthase / folylpolyglutamate synthase
VAFFIFDPMDKLYNEAINFLYSQLPVYHHIGPAAYKKDLSNTLQLCGLLDNPQHKFKCIHITGTNGKGSSAHMVAAILQSVGFKTGLYTSPHLKDFGERIKINGKEIRKEYVVEFVNRMKEAMSEIKPSFFELTVAMAFEYFALEKIDFAVVEVGLGGRLDSTNIINPEVSLITNIGYDHMDILGNSLTEIAYEKAGIIKQNKPVVISERQAEIENIFIAKASETKSEIYFASDLINLGTKGHGIIEIKSERFEFLLEPELKGIYQEKNIKGVLQTIAVLRDRGYQISEEAIKNGINNTITLTGLKGRWQKIGERPMIICDTAHNAEGLAEIIKQIKMTPHKKLRWIFGMVKDKSPDKVLAILPGVAQYYFCQAKIPRAMDASELLEKAKTFGLVGVVIKDVNAAIEMAMNESDPYDLIMVGGSTFVVAEVEGI